MPFLLPNQQCQSTEGTETVSATVTLLNSQQVLLTICCASDWSLYSCQSASGLAPENSLKKQQKTLPWSDDGKLWQYKISMTNAAKPHLQTVTYCGEKGKRRGKRCEKGQH